MIKYDVKLFPPLLDRSYYCSSYSIGSTPSRLLLRRVYRVRVHPLHVQDGEASTVFSAAGHLRARWRSCMPRRCFDAATRRASPPLVRSVCCREAVALWRPCCENSMAIAAQVGRGVECHAACPSYLAASGFRPSPEQADRC